MFKVQGKAITNNNKQLTVNKQSSKKSPETKIPRLYVLMKQITYCPLFITYDYPR
jgi:hypothetical protein